ncbi:sigma-54-dependent Fis family transcriptional regulator [candidate division KSB1 bacterium]|nr:sigma-54-dependent Fis family transcriptional regulator [candidate division KSB1 bacterium]
MHILVVDDDSNVCQSLAWLLQKDGHRVHTCRSGEDAVAAVDKEMFNLVFLDVVMPGMGGLSALERMLSRERTLRVVMISGAADLSMAVRAIKMGAYDFLEKPLNPEKVQVVVNHIQKQEQVRAQVENLQSIVDQEYKMIGTSAAMQQVYRAIEMAAPSEGRILIMGENGTGKELVAREIHKKSGRANQPFIQLNCAAIPRELIESELFGYEKGAFTGAAQRKTGLIEKAHGGTLLLDEVGDMALETQAKLLRVLQENEFYRVGGTSAYHFDVRIISATNKDLQKEISLGNFRQDLYFRLNVIPLVIPPLRQHREDIPLLTKHFLTNYCRRNGKKMKQVTEDAMIILQNYPWPGNVRELKNIMERLAIMIEKKVIDDEAVSLVLATKSFVQTGDSDSELPLKVQLQNFEKKILKEGMIKHQGNISRLAAALKTDRANLHRKLKQYGIKYGVSA